MPHYRQFNEVVKARLGGLHPEGIVIYEERRLGCLNDTSRAVSRDVMARLVGRGAEAIVLGCTEISLLVRPQDASVPLFDTPALHAWAAAERGLEDEHWKTNHEAPSHGCIGGQASCAR